MKAVPASIEIKYALAEAYLDAHLNDRARLELQDALKLPLSNTRTNESRRAQEKARKLLEKLNSKLKPQRPESEIDWLTDFLIRVRIDGTRSMPR